MILLIKQSYINNAQKPPSNQYVERHRNLFISLIPSSDTLILKLHSSLKCELVHVQLALHVS